MITALAFLIATANSECARSSIGSENCQPAAGSANLLPRRRIWTFDQLRLPPPKDESVLKILEPDHSMEEVITHLKQLGIAFTSGQAMLREEDAPPELIKLIVAQPSEPIVVPDGKQLSVNVVIDVRWAGSPEDHDHE